MKTLLSALLLGLIQGLTEFLPVSSSGHLVIVQHFLHSFDQNSLLFDTVLHGGTLASILLFFRRELWQMFQALLPASRAPVGDPATRTENRKLLLFLAIGTLPAVIFGLLFKHRIERLFETPALVAVCLMVTGIILALADRSRFRTPPHQGDRINSSKSLLIGLAQALAITPGISRSGCTISAALLLGIEAKAAATFSFLLAIPAIGGAIVLQAKELLKVASLGAVSLAPYAVGFLMAFVSGYFAIGYFMRIIPRRRLLGFSIYLWCFAALTLILLGLGF